MNTAHEKYTDRVPSAGPTPTVDVVGRLAEEIDGLEKSAEGLRQKLGFFLEPEPPAIAPIPKPALMNGGSELTGRLDEMTRRVVSIREELNRIIHRVV